MASDENKFLWNALVILTIIVGVTAAILIVHKDKYFPSLYAAHQEHSVREDSSQIHTGANLADAIHQAERDTVPVNISEPPKQLAIGAGEYILVAGSFLSEQYASSFRETLHQELGNSAPEIIPVLQSNTTYYRVVVRHSGNRSEVKEFQGQLSQAGHAQSWIYKQ